jgi:hypothetical protein
MVGPRMSECSKCKSVHVKHHACGVCGTYRGKTAFNAMKKVEKTAKKIEKKTAKKTEKTEKK